MTAVNTHVACPHCGATNRIPAARLGEDPVCGRCGQPLLDGQPVELSDANFDQVVERSDLPVVVDFWAPWCGPCRQMAPQFEQAARTLKGRALLVKVNSDDNPRTAVALRHPQHPHAGEAAARPRGGARGRRAAGRADRAVRGG